MPKPGFPSKLACRVGSPERGARYCDWLAEVRNFQCASCPNDVFFRSLRSTRLHKAMALLQPKLSLKVAQRQILTPGLMQMISVLALNKLELREMINAEIVENPVLEEMDENVPLLDEIDEKEAERDRTAQEIADQANGVEKEKDPFEEIDFGSYFRDYLDPGFHTPDGFEPGEKSSFENFLSRAGNLAEHLGWQLGSISLSDELRTAAEYVIGNLDENGYLAATDEDLLPGIFSETSPACKLLAEAIRIVQALDPAGVAARSLRECLMLQIESARRDYELQAGRTGKSAPHNDNSFHEHADGDRASAGEEAALWPEIFSLASRIADKHLDMLRKRDLHEMARELGKPLEAVRQAVDFIRTLDPRPGQRYNRSEARLIEPDVAFVKRDGKYAVVMNDQDMPALRLNRGYRKLLTQEGAGKEARDYVKERYRSALQLMRNIEQRRNTIVRTCEAIVRHQEAFLEYGVEALKPMMIKDVAEEIGVHPSTVSRAVSSKYAHTPQGVYELRFFFSEGANGPEGSSTPLVLLKRRVRKIIEEEDPHKPLTDDLIASLLGSQGIVVTRRTVAKYREDMGIPSTHLRRVRD